MNYTEDQIAEAFENEKLYVMCVNTVSDDEGIYNVKDSEYKVIDEDGDCWIVEVEESSECDGIQMFKDDEDFKLVIK